MTKLVRFFLIFAAAESVYAIAAALLTDTNPYPALIAAVCALGGFFLTDYLQGEHDRRIRETRAATWRRRGARP